MLNDYFISRDAPGFLLHYLDSLAIDTPEFRAKLLAFSREQQISYELWWQLLEEFDALVEKPALGIDIGKSIRVEHCGVLGYLFRTSQNVMEALSCYQRYERLLYAGGRVRADIENGILKLAWPTDLGESTLLSDALLLSALVAVIREILEDETIHPVAVHFYQAIPAESISPYQRYFQCPVKSANTRLEILYRVEDLHREIPSHDQTLHQLLGQQAQTLMDQLPAPDAFLDAVRAAIVKRLHDEKSDAESVAKSLEISTRSLHRKLKARDLQFKDVLQDVRKTMAVYYLKDPKLSLAEITLLLGYSEQSAFNRAHKLWFGMTPKQHRSQLLHTLR